MKRKLYVVFSLLMVASMLLAACATSTQAPAQPTTAAPAASEAPTEAAVVEPTAVPQPTEAPKSDRKGGWLDKIVFSAIAEAEPAVAQLQAGTVDMYAVAADDPSAYEKVKADPNLKYVETYGSNNQLILNSVKCTDTNIFNPFTDQKIREAMNWAVDRNYIAQEIMGGLAKPKYTALTSAFADYSRYADVMSEIETKYAYNLDKAKEVVDAQMTAAGATKNADGKWEMNGKPVTIIGLIRTEDSRKEIGNYFATQLESLGFTVDRQEKTRSEAGPIWQGQPEDCKFGYYTAGWISTAISRDDGNMFVQYNTGKMQNIPLFNAYQPSEALQAVEDKLYTNNFKNMDERGQLFKEALEKSMEESWWGVWVSDNITYSPYKVGVSSAYDLAGGIASAQLWPYTARLDGKEGGELKIAQSGIMVQPWNPIAGSNWTDDAMPQRATMDWGMVYDPYTGLSVPKLVEKADLVVEEGLPVTKNADWVNLSFEKEIQVPADAWADWDPVAQKFITVGEKYPDGITTKTKSVVYYRPELWQTTWHDGSPLSIGDFVMEMIMTFDPAMEKSKVYNESLASGLESWMSHFKGVKIVSTDPLTIETYDDLFALDAELTITDWYPSRYYPASSTNGMLAWHDITPALLAEENGELALTTEKAQDKKVEWTSLLAGPSLETQAKYLDQAAKDSYLPYAPTMSQYVKPEEITLRYENLKKWYDAKKHLVLGTGPYFIDQVFPVEGTLTLARYENYLFPAEDWANFSEPMIATAAVDGPTSVKAGEEASFDVSVTFKDQPYPTADIEKVSYILYNSKNEVVGQGEATNSADGLYQVVLGTDVTSKLEAGGSKLSVVVSSKVVSIPTFLDYEFVVTQ